MVIGNHDQLEVTSNKDHNTCVQIFFNQQFWAWSVQSAW